MQGPSSPSFFETLTSLPSIAYKSGKTYAKKVFNSPNELFKVSAILSGTLAAFYGAAKGATAKQLILGSVVMGGLGGALTILVVSLAMITFNPPRPRL